MCHGGVEKKVMEGAFQLEKWRGLNKHTGQCGPVEPFAEVERNYTILTHFYLLVFFHLMFPLSRLHLVSLKKHVIILTVDDMMQ